MKTRLSAVILVALAASMMVACEEKKPETAGGTVPKATDAMKDAANKTGDAVKDAANKTGDAVKDAADKTGDAAKDAANKAGDAAKEAATALTDSAKSSMNDYLSSLGKLTDTLAGAKDPISGAKAATEAKPLTDKLSGAVASLDKLSPELQKTLKDTFKDQLSGVTSKFQAQVDRITGDKTLGPILGDMVKGLKLFE